MMTVVICTRNRAASLARTLASIEQADRPYGEWEVLVVDNDSTDDTQSVIGRFVGRLPVRTIIELTPGVANARNTANSSAKGDYIVSTDDDVLVAVDWLTSYEDAFARWPEVDLFGGRITPVLEEPVTPWFQAAVRQLSTVIAARNLGEEPLVIKPEWDMIPYGANFGIRTSIALRFPFNPQRGPGTDYFGEETTAFMDMLKAGCCGRWLPQAGVQHLISPQRQTEAYVSWWYGMLGKTLVWSGEEQLVGPRVFGVPRWLWRRLLVRTIDYRLARLKSPPEVWVAKLIALALDRGRVGYFWSERHAR